MVRKKKQQRIVAFGLPRYRYWQALYMSFYSSRLYADVAKRWYGLGLFYLLFVIAIAMIPLSLRVGMEVNRYFDEQLIAPIQAIPTLMVRKGQVEFDKPMPYLIRNAQGKVVIVVDTTGVVTKIDNPYSDVIILITKDKLYFRLPQATIFHHLLIPPEKRRIEMQSLDGMSGQLVAEDWIQSSRILTFKHYLDFFMYPFLLTFFFGAYSTIIIMIALMGQFCAQIIFKVKLQFSQAIRLFMVSSTPQVVVLLMVAALDTVIPLVGLIYIVLWALYFSLAVLSYKYQGNDLVLQ